MTIFIPLSSASTWLHNELRIALRSWEKFGLPIENVLIIGHKPDWLINVHHLEFQDRFNKVENIFRKVKLAASLYPEFIFANDDHFLIKPVTEIPYYYSCLLKDFKISAGDTFLRYVDTTFRLFPDGKYFDVHFPMICQREFVDRLEWKKDVLFKSYYCNAADIEGVNIADCKINGHIRQPEIDIFTKWRSFISTGEKISFDLKKFLFETFPEKSRWES